MLPTPLKTPATLSELFAGVPLKSTTGNPKPYNSRHAEFSPPQYVLGRLFFSEGGSGEGLSELVMEFPERWSECLPAWQTTSHKRALRIGAEIWEGDARRKTSFSESGGSP